MSRVKMAAWATLNIVFIAIFFLMYSRTWIPVEERGLNLPLSPGAGIFWILVCLPILVVCFVANIVVAALFSRQAAIRAGVFIFMMLSSMVWVIALFIDFSLRR
ncbi:MAG: hypothetical protein ACK4RV_03275 [Caulobacter sp.]